MAFMITGISKSRTPAIFKPITIKSEAIIIVKYPPSADANTLPVIAHIIPITENTIAVPKIKKHSCINVRKGVSFEYPPTYPTIKGSIASEQGDIEAITPPANEAKNINIQTCAPVVPAENICVRLSIYKLFQVVLKYFRLNSAFYASLYISLFVFENSCRNKFHFVFFY